MGKRPANQFRMSSAVRSRVSNVAIPSSIPSLYIVAMVSASSGVARREIISFVVLPPKGGSYKVALRAFLSG